MDAQSNNRNTYYAPRAATVCRYGNAIIAIGLAFYFFLIPFAILVDAVSDSALRYPGIPHFAERLHRSLTPKYERWARERIGSGAATKLGIEEISATEWPLFGSVFYLWATEELQKDWEFAGENRGIAPAVYARDAIDAATALVLDEGHAAWVKEHWGDDYLHKQNCFYRMLLISAATSHEQLLGTGEHLDLLRDQVESLSTEIDASPIGLIEDYPYECYPGDVMMAVAAIRRADAVLGTDHSAFVQRAFRAFDDERFDETGLPPYAASAEDGKLSTCARGCSNSYVLIAAPELWPETAREWYARCEEHFWQRKAWAAGFREFPKGPYSVNWYADVDSGPVIAGYGAAASAFGIAAARANGRFDHAYPLAAEALVASWPLPDGTLLVPRILSNLADAPYLGEAAMLYCLTRQPVEGVEATTGGRMPPLVYIGLAAYPIVGLLIVGDSLLRVRRWRRSPRGVPSAGAQLGVWAVLLATGVLLGILVSWVYGLPAILIAQLLPRRGKRSRRDSVTGADPEEVRQT